MTFFIERKIGKWTRQAIALNVKMIPIFSNQTLVLQLHHKYNVVVVAEAQFQEPISSVVVKDSKSYCFIHHKAPVPAFRFEETKP